MSNQENSIVDAYGQVEEDEFYELSCQLETEQGPLEVKPVTYALMEAWKAHSELDEPIEIEEDSNFASLEFDAELTVELNDVPYALETNNVIEVDEDSKTAAIFRYLTKTMPLELMDHCIRLAMDANQSLVYGALEVVPFETEEGEHTGLLRLKWALALDGILVGKVNAIENLILNSEDSLQDGVEMLLEDPQIAEWLLEA